MMYSRSCFVGVACLFALAAMFFSVGVHAEPVEITDTALKFPSFEYPEICTGPGDPAECLENEIPSGQSVGEDWNPNVTGTFINAVVFGDSRRSDGVRLYATNDTEFITQHVDPSVTVKANTIYTLQVDIGDARSFDDPERISEGTIQLFVHTAAQTGGTVEGTQGVDFEVATLPFFSDTGTSFTGGAGPDPAFGLEDDTWTLTLDTSDPIFSPFVGGTMTVRLNTLADPPFNLNFPVMDNVRLFEDAPHGPLADFDSDGDVDGNDYLLWQRGLGTTYDATDLANWESEFGISSLSVVAAAVPEPASCWLILCCGSLLAWNVRSRR